MPKIALLGNCQIQSIAALLPLMLDDVELLTFDYSSNYSREEENRKAFSEKLNDCDWILTQPTHLSYTSSAGLRERFGGKTCVFGNFYFRGLFPDSCYVGDFEHRLHKPSTVHSVIILDAFLSGLSPTEAARSFTLDNYNRLGLLDAWPSSMQEMRRRDEESALDVPAADVMEEACRAYPAFLTMNHPSITFLADYLSRVLDTVGLRHRRVNGSRVPDPLAIYDMTPIEDVVAEYLQLPYRVTQQWMLGWPNKRFVGREEIIFRFYSAYASTGRGSLTINSPADLARRYEADPELKYLVSGADETVNGGGSRRTWTPSNADAGRHALLESAETIGEIKEYVHKLHSFSEVNDPKIERLLHDMTVRSNVPVALAALDERSQQASAQLHALHRKLALLTALVAACAVAAVASLIVHAL